MTQTSLDVLNAINLQVPCKKVLHSNPHWSGAHVKAAVKAYKHFLFVAKTYRGRFPVVPHLSVDEIWHQHILCTKNYMDFCDAYFGYYFHHDPGEGGAPTTSDVDGYALTCAAIVNHFGEGADPRLFLSQFYPAEMPSVVQARRALEG